MVKKSTNEHDYFKNIKDFLTFILIRRQAMKQNLQMYWSCKLNWKSIGENEVANIEDENIWTYW